MQYRYCDKLHKRTNRTEPNLYCQSKIIQLENQNTKPNLAFDERFPPSSSLSLCVCVSIRSVRRRLSFDYFSVDIPIDFIFIFVDLFFVCWPDCPFFSCFVNGIHFSDQFPYICIYLPRRLFLLLSVRIACIIQLNSKSIFRYIVVL